LDFSPIHLKISSLAASIMAKCLRIISKQYWRNDVWFWFRKAIYLRRLWSWI